MTGSDEHLKPLRLFDLARKSGTQLTDIEKQHLRDCEECPRILEVFARQFGKRTEQPGDAA
jgi:hypothetical protein